MGALSWWAAGWVGVMFLFVGSSTLVVQLVELRTVTAVSWKEATWRCCWLIGLAVTLMVAGTALFIRAVFVP